MKSNKLYLLVAGLLLAVLLSACGDNTPTPTTTSAPAAAPTTAPAPTKAATTAAATTAVTTAAATTAATTAAATTMPAMAMTTAAATTTAVATTSAAATTASAEAKTMNITIQDFKFAPDTLTIPVGTKVIWTNKDTSSHTVTGDSAKTLDSPLIKPNDKFEFTFTQAGTFEYHCEPHPFMKAKIVVTA